MRGAPGPLLALCTAIAAAALTCSQPLVLAALAVGTAVMLFRSPGLRWPTLALAAMSVVSFTLINPFVSIHGDTVIVAGPRLPGRLLDLEITVEELAYGFCAGLRLATVAMAGGVFLLRCDPDRLTAMAARIAPRSALTVALGARLAPTLARDAASLHDAARARGLALGTGGARARTVAAAVLVAPLLATGLERGLETAEAMTARGFGAGRRTMLPATRPPLHERVLLLPAVALVAIVVVLRATGSATFRFYETLGDPARTSALAGAAACLVVLAVAALVLERWSSPS